MPLAMVSPGEKVRLTAIRGGRRLRSRMADLGLTQGLTLQVVQQCRHGPMIIMIKDTRLAIGRGMAFHIMVEPA